MSLNIKKLSNVSEKPDGKVTARCPACALDGKDKNGEHLVIFPDGKFGCIKYEGDAAHRNKIHALVGNGKRMAHIPVKLPVVPFHVPKSYVVMRLGEFPRFSASVRRAWSTPGEQSKQSKGCTSEENLQMEFPFMENLPEDTATEEKKPQGDHKDSDKSMIRSSFFNVPLRRTGICQIPAPPPLPPLPLNPLKRQI